MENRPKKCPVCNSKRISVSGDVFYCKKCGYINKEHRVVIRGS